VPARVGAISEYQHLGRSSYDGSPGRFASGAFQLAVNFLKETQLHGRWGIDEIIGITNQIIGDYNSFQRSHNHVFDLPHVASSNAFVAAHIKGNSIHIKFAADCGFTAKMKDGTVYTSTDPVLLHDKVGLHYIRRIQVQVLDEHSSAESWDRSEYMRNPTKFIRDLTTSDDESVRAFGQGIAKNVFETYIKTHWIEGKFRSDRVNNPDLLRNDSFGVLNGDTNKDHRFSEKAAAGSRIITTVFPLDALEVLVLTTDGYSNYTPEITATAKEVLEQYTKLEKDVQNHETGAGPDFDKLCRDFERAAQLLIGLDPMEYDDLSPIITVNDPRAIAELESYKNAGGFFGHLESIDRPLQAFQLRMPEKTAVYIQF
jgi:hypothetical protein